MQNFKSSNLIRRMVRKVCNRRNSFFKGIDTDFDMDRDPEMVESNQILMDLENKKIPDLGKEQLRSILGKSGK